MPRSSHTPQDAPPGCVWIAEASRLTGLSVKTLYNYRHQSNKGPKSFEIGRKIAYALDDVNAWVAAQRNPVPDVVAERDSRPPEPRKLPRASTRAHSRRELDPAAA
ncbi:AlpA family transcriptional regulator [Streptomyces sp. W4I9-2]|uniref:helix-turn-helix transcriptional regulator n=1 Tax=Streptomyces sp. W4I9-2 TaxID=3042297 RepID=UPI002781308E|nr:helix-turn-helix domain-containing protein [Streptomyces sp. W4I9-2]MDQ0694300.1 putative DNA-binding transcriptional regulator AlpA [Streptomyces sp. W4I9-2]